MDINQPSVPLAITANGRVILGSTDLTDSLFRFAFEVSESGRWCAFQCRVDIDENGIQLDFPHGTINRHLGSNADTPAQLSTTPADIKEIIDAGGYATPLEDKIFEWLQQQGVVSS